MLHIICLYFIIMHYGLWFLWIYSVRLIITVIVFVLLYFIIFFSPLPSLWYILFSPSIIPINIYILYLWSPLFIVFQIIIRILHCCALYCFWEYNIKIQILYNNIIYTYTVKKKIIIIKYNPFHYYRYLR